MTAPLALSYAEARARVLAAVRPLSAEHVPVEYAAGRALRETVHAPHALPPFRNTAMDGFAVRVADLALASATAPVTLRVTEVLPAGHAGGAALGPGEAARIMTGAPLPPGADAVVPFEECERHGEGATERCVVARPSRPGDHVREAGADLAAGAVVLEAGRELSAHDLALLVAIGHARPLVSPRPRVAVLSTGDELVDADQPLRPGLVRDSNLPMLARLVEEAGCDLTRFERLPDDAERVATALRECLAASDVVLTIGGVSAGDFDPVKQAIAEVGGIESWRVAMRPGRPQVFGAPEGRLCFGLPGNPASVACTFEVLVRPALRALQGHAALDRPRVPVRVAQAMESRAGRTDFVRARLEWRDGLLWATPAGAQVSGHLTPQAHAHALLVVPETAERLAAGDAAEALVLRLPSA